MGVCTVNELNIVFNISLHWVIRRRLKAQRHLLLSLQSAIALSICKAHPILLSDESAAETMAAMVSLQSSMTALSLSSSSFLGHRLQPSTIFAAPVRFLLSLSILIAFSFCLILSGFLFFLPLNFVLLSNYASKCIPGSLVR